jgi:hypothetical protein
VLKSVEVPAWYKTLLGVPSKEDFEKLYGRKVETVVRKKGEYTMENTVLEMRKESFIMRILYRAVEMIVANSLGENVDRIIRAVPPPTPDTPIKRRNNSRSSREANP